jgi:hypothetical protein
MALSGSEYVLFGPGSHYKLQIDWTATQNTANNQSTISATLKMYSDPSWSMYSSSSTTGTIVIDGTTYDITHSGGISTGGGSWITLGSASKTVTHGSDGTKTFSLSGSYRYNNVNVSGTIIGNTSISSQNFTLNTIPRETKLSSPNPPSWTAGNAVTFSLTRYSSNFSETVKLEAQKSDGTWLTVSTLTGCTTSAAFTGTSMDTGEITTIFTALGGRASCPSRLTITTYSGSGSTGSVIGSAQVYTGTITAPAASTGSIGNPTGVSATAGQESSTVYVDQSMTINLTTHGSGFTHTLNFKTSNTGSTVHQALGVGTQLVYTFTTSEQNTVYAATPNSIELDGQVDVYTYYNGVQVQGVTNFDINYRVRNSNPTFSATGITYKDNISAISTITGDNQYIVQNASDLLVSLPTPSNATPKNSATISYYVAQCGGSTKQVNYSSSATITFDLGKINLSASDKIYITAYDSRGLSTQINIPVTIVPWKPPTANSTSKRDDGFTDPSTITLTGGTYSKVTISSSDKNDIVSVKYQYTTKGSAWPTGTATGALTDFPGMTHSGGTFSAPNLAVTLDSGSTWSTEVQIVDKIMQALAQTPVKIDNTVSVGTPSVFIDVANNALGVGKFPSGSNMVDIAGPIAAMADGQPSTTNTSTGAIRISAYNNLLQIGTGNTNNDRNAWIQSRHLDNAYSTAYGSLQLNPLGGLVSIGGSEVVANGSNTNGSWVKFYNGIMICYGSVASAAGTDVKNTGVLTYPVAFTSAPYTMVTFYSLAGVFADYYIYNNASNGFTIYHIGRNAEDISGRSFRWMAIGAWK